MLPLETAATIVKAKTPNEKYSKLPNLRAKSAMKGDRKLRRRKVIQPAKNELKIPIPNARAGSPLSTAIGYASNVVATDAGVPGILSRLAEMRPPEMPPTKMPINKHSPGIDAIPKVNGSIKTMPIVAVRPGTAPKIIPKIVPAKVNKSGPM
jgi:hypothetical protein